MAKTYRLRHLRKIDARKYIDGTSRRRWKDLIPEAPILPVTSHPWVSWARIGEEKAEYKRSGNRRARRVNRLLVKTKSWDAEFFSKLHGWNIYSLH